jgi:hypothetical protein
MAIKELEQATWVWTTISLKKQVNKKAGFNHETRFFKYRFIDLC